ncbi:MAG: isoamylase early set domain-containing protein [Desulfocapsaceae bacterium]|jgi:1,4-alpha-glucan branching enzyme|nr:isoamylase early set domain-containing protein [Desulfocapsaceae bacterium]
MLKTSYSKTGTICRVTFKYGNPENAENAVIAGDFNGWSLKDNPMKKLKNGSFSATLSLQAGKSYRFRYVLNGSSWVNDEEAHRYTANDYGEDDSVVVV